MIIKGYLFSLAFGVLCISISGLFYKLGVKTIYTRKITHILIGFEWVILYHYFATTIHFAIICFAFLLLLLISYVFNMFPQLSSQKENAPGTIYYGIAMNIMGIVILFIPEMILPFGIGVFCTSFGDGFAGVFGNIKKYNFHIFENKTFFGSISCFVFCLLSTVTISCIYELNLEFHYILFISIFATELELVSKKGIDNILVTLGASILAYFLSYHSEHTLNYIVPILLTVPTIILVKKKHALDNQGIIIALILNALATIAFGNKGFIVLITFFIGSIIADKVKKSKTKLPTETRNAIQVVSNGAMSGLSAFLYILNPHKIFLLLFISALAEALSDTVASGIGALSKKSYDPFKRKNVSRGTSGGMSIIGTISSFVASSLMASLSFLFTELTIIDALIIAFSGFAGAIFDSWLGSCAQAIYICRKCKCVVEEKKHCEEACDKISGVVWIDNNVVNLFSTVFSGIFTIIVFVFCN